MREFLDTHCFNFEQTASKRLLRQVAERYVRESESYDRTVCSGPIIRGSVQPMTYEQRGLISSHAQKLFERLLAENHGHFDRKELRREIARVDQA